MTMLNKFGVTITGIKDKESELNENCSINYKIKRFFINISNGCGLKKKFNGR